MQHQLRTSKCGSWRAEGTPCGCRLVREVERCKQACLQLVLLRPEVTLTCFDRSQKAFLLRLIKVRYCAKGLAGGDCAHLALQETTLAWCRVDHSI